MHCFSLVKIIYTKGGGQKPIHNYATSCNNINQLSRFVVQIYARYGNMLTPLICKPANYFQEAPSFLHLHAEHLIASLDTLCPNPVQEGPKLSHNLGLLIPSEGLTTQLDRIAPFQAEIVKVVNALVKAVASRNKRSLEGGGEGDVDGDTRPKKKAKTNN
jgi:hypothetical protein